MRRRMSLEDLRIGVLGATGAAGEALLLRLADSRFAPLSILPFGSTRSRVEQVEIGERSFPVQPLTALGEVELDLVFSCLPASVAGRMLPSVMGRGAFVIDIGDSLAGVVEIPLVLPGVSMPDPQDVARAGGLRTPSPAGWMLSRIAAPLRVHGLTGISGVVNLPASAWGRRAVDELSEQVVASFNLKDPPRRIFPEGLAFDALLDEADAGEWTARETLAMTEVEALAEIAGVGVQIVTQPLFAGATAGLHLRGTSLTPDLLDDCFAQVQGVNAVQTLGALRPRKAIGKRSIFYGAVRPDPLGDGVHLWVVADPATGAGGAVPVALAEWLVDNGVIGGTDA